MNTLIPEDAISAVNVSYKNDANHGGKIITLSGLLA